jgi:CMP-N,N'-diacetyllegionaminic acid synthase
MSNVVAIIPARGGSIGIPDKNLRKVGGKSLIQRAIECAVAVSEIDTTVVSSDSSVILDCASSLSVIAHRRSAKSSTGESTADMVIRDLLRASERYGINDFTTLVYLQPTSPFRTAKHVSCSLGLFSRDPKSSLISVKKLSVFPQKSFFLDDGGYVSFAPWTVNPGSNRQGLDPIYYPNGAIYIFSVASFRKHNVIPVAKARAFLMDEFSSTDIDSLHDLEMAERLADCGAI